MTAIQSVRGPMVAGGVLAAFMFAGLFVGQAQAAPVSIPYSETFESSGTTGGYPDVTFTSPANNWSIVSGGAQYSTSTGGQVGTAAVQVDEAVTTPITVSTTLRVVSTTSASDVGLAIFGSSATFGLTSGHDHYLVDFKPRTSTNTTTARILKIVGGGVTTIKGDTTIPTIDLASDYRLTVEATPNGGSLDLTLKLTNLTTMAESTISGSDPSPLTGTYFGLRNRSSVNGNFTINHRDFSIVPEPATLGLLGLGLVACAPRRRR